jgi:hypothetical protein
MQGMVEKLRLVTGDSLHVVLLLSLLDEAGGTHEPCNVSISRMASKSERIIFYLKQQNAEHFLRLLTRHPLTISRQRNDTKIPFCTAFFSLLPLSALANIPLSALSRINECLY